MPSYEFENGQLREENNALRHSRNAAQQRAEQAERERDEAREVIDRAIEILGSPVPDGVSTKDQMANEHLNVNALLTNFRKPYHKPQPAPTVKADAPLEWTPKTGAEIAADMEGKPAILPTDFDVNAAPDIDAIMSNLTVSLAAQDVIHASLAKDNADGYLEDGEPCRAIPYLSEAIGYLIDALKGIQKGSAS